VRNNRGQSIVEVALLIAFIAFVGIAAVILIGETPSSVSTHIAAALKHKGH
jgi:Flp pilus assembly pilin Flp